MLEYNEMGVMDVFGETVIYGGKTIIASVELGAYDGKGSGFVDSARSDKAQIWVRVEDVPSPKAKDEVYIKGNKWYVDHISETDDKLHCIEIYKNIRAVRP